MMSFLSHIEIPASEHELSRPKAGIRKIHDPTDYTAVTPRPTQKWTVEQKTVLFILKQQYEISWPDIKILFHELFRSELSSPVGPSTAAMRNMDHRIQKERYAPTGSWIPIREALERKAAEIGIELAKKEIVVREIRYSQLPDSLSDNEQVSGSESDSTLLGDEYELPTTPSKFSRNRPTRGALEIGRPKSSSLQERHINGREIPKIGFRTFTPESQGINGPDGFLAGLFVNGAPTAQPDPMSREFQSEAIRHVAKVHTGSTPFISITSSLVRSLHLAFKNPTTSTIALIDLHKAGRVIASNENLPSTPKIHWVESLKLNTGYTYHGGSELLVWGDIQKDAILSTLSPSQILARTTFIQDHLDPFQFQAIQTACTTKEIYIKISKHRLMQTLETGKAVGTLAQEFGVPAELVHLFVQLVVKEWKFRGDNWEKNDKFIQGVLLGFEKSEAPPRAQPRVFEDFIDSLETLRGLVETEEPGQWREIHGYGQYKIRVYESMADLGGSS